VKLRNIFRPQFMWEYPDPGSAGGAGNPAPGTAPPGQGQPQDGADPTNQGFWAMFPDVPEEQRPLLEPHIRSAVGRVTQLEQQLAPFKPFLDAGYSPQAAEGLIRFSADFERNPADMWLRMGAMLQQRPGPNGRPVVDPELDLDHLAALVRGEDPDAQQQGQVPGQQQGPVEGQLPPEVLQYIQGLQQEVEDLKQGFTQDRVQRQELVQDRLLDQQLTQMKSSLKEAGWPEDLLTDEELYSRLIVAGGNVESALSGMVNVRSGLLKGFTEQNQGQPGDLNMPNGAPPVPAPQRPSGRGNDSWGKARTGATQRLARANQAAAQQH
jgi:hypothetical protein